MFSSGEAKIAVIQIREGMVDKKGIEHMSKRFGLMLLTGGLEVRMVGTESHTIICMVESMRELFELQRFATNME